MKLRFWGVRGSIPAPGEETRRYGGNTTCLEVRSDDGSLIYIDAGTGIHKAALSLPGDERVRAHIFLTHTHWDHIQGLPFFLPIFRAGNDVILHGPFDPVGGGGIEEVMEVQMQYRFFPVREAELRANMEYHALMPGISVRVGDATILPVLLNHPVVNYGYRIDCNGKSLFFTGDHEPHTNIYAPGDEGHNAYEEMLERQRGEIVAALAGVQVLVADCSYTPEEYAGKVGWGHGTYDSSIALARAAGARTLICTHHEPTRSDAALEAAFAAALLRNPAAVRGMDIRLAAEGLTLDW